MASVEDHFQQARGNRVHAEHLLVTYPRDPIALQWAVTAAFYCAVHSMNAHLARRSVHIRNHYQRDAALANPANGVPPDIYRAYRTLKVRSEGARYWMQRFQASRVRSEILDTHLARVTAFVSL